MKSQKSSLVSCLRCLEITLNACIDYDDYDGGLQYTVVCEDGDKEYIHFQECEKVVTLSDDIEWEV